ncbi:CPBP family intramembrane glutamic endopeptidase [Tsuneonella sp. HG249]
MSEALPPARVAVGLGLQTALFVAAGALMWHYSGREHSDFIDFGWRPVAGGLSFGLLMIALAAIAFRQWPAFLEHTAHLQSHLAVLFAERADSRLYVWIALCAGLGEEALFRGGIMTLVQDSAGPVFAIVASALIFALFHLAKPQVGALIFMIGLMFGAVYWWTGSLLTAIIGHAVYDVWALHVLRSELLRLGYINPPETS